MLKTFKIVSFHKRTTSINKMYCESEQEFIFQFCLCPHGLMVIQHAIKHCNVLEIAYFNTVGIFWKHIFCNLMSI